MRAARIGRRSDSWLTFLAAYSIQNWLESCPQSYLEGTEYGYQPGEKEPADLLDDPVLRQDAIRSTVQLVVGEKCALAASSGLINAAPDEASKCFLATQTLDEARHVEVFTHRLLDLGVAKKDLDETIREHANPNLVKFAEVLLEKVDKKDFVAGVVGQNIVLEGMAFSVFEMLKAISDEMNPKFAHTLSGTIADERRHVGLRGKPYWVVDQAVPGAQARDRADAEGHVVFHACYFRGRVPSQPRGAADRGSEGGDARVRCACRLPRCTNLAELSPADMEEVLSDTVLREFKVRLGRIGIDYQTPAQP